jgi:hypothetical protein
VLADARGIADPVRHREPKRPIQLMVTDDEKALFDAHAGRLGLPTATWLRMLGLREIEGYAVELPSLAPATKGRTG